MRGFTVDVDADEVEEEEDDDEEDAVVFVLDVMLRSTAAAASTDVWSWMKQTDPGGATSLLLVSSSATC